MAGRSEATCPIEHLGTIDSTNAEGLRRAAAGQIGPLCLIAERQHAGRGRSGRAWASPVGNLHCSYLFSPGCSGDRLAQLALVAGVGAFDALREVSHSLIEPRHLVLKWPNDILLGLAKVGGILVESTVYDGRTVAVIGVGVNLAATPTGLGREATCFGAHGLRLDANDVCPALCRHLEAWLAQWDAGGNFEAIRQAWLGRSLPVGQPMAVTAGPERIQGVFSGLDADGALLLTSGDGRARRYSFGDVEIVTEDQGVENRS